MTVITEVVLHLADADQEAWPLFDFYLEAEMHRIDPRGRRDYWTFNAPVGGDLSERHAEFNHLYWPDFLRVVGNYPWRDPENVCLTMWSPADDQSYVFMGIDELLEDADAFEDAGKL